MWEEQPKLNKMNIKTALSRLAFLGLIMALLYTTAANWRTISGRWNPDFILNSPENVWQERLTHLIRDLPEGAQKVGYLSERDIPGEPYDPIDTNAEMALTQFAIAPRILVLGADAPYVIGNYGRDDYHGQFENIYQLKLLRYYGYGIYLFKGKTAR